MNEVIRANNKFFTVPVGYRKLYWQFAKPGQRVFIAGTRDGRPWAYGPHIVVDQHKKVLKNERGQRFVEQTDGVLVKLLEKQV